MLLNLTVLAQVTNPALNLPYTTGEAFLQDILPRLIGIGFIIGALIFLFIMIIGAIQWIASGGDKTAIEAARGKIMNALIGIVILFSLFAIFTLVSNFFGINLLQIDLGPLRVGGGTGGCFPAGTKVKMADGTYKEIQEIRPGDIVYSYNLESGNLAADKVAKLLVHTNYPGGYLIINDRLMVTGNHGVWVVNKASWERADTLSIGDALLNPAGEEVLITSIAKIEGKNTVYNLHLNGDDHNYFSEDFLVHNQVFQK